MLTKIKETWNDPETKETVKLLVKSIALGVVVSVATHAVIGAGTAVVEKIQDHQNQKALEGQIVED